MKDEGGGDGWMDGDKDGKRSETRTHHLFVFWQDEEVFLDSSLLRKWK